VTVSRGSPRATSGYVASPLWPAFLRKSTAALNELGGNRQQQRQRSQAYYELMRERVRVLASTQPTQTAAYYAGNLQNTPGFATTPNRYGQVLALVRAGDAKKAVPLADKLAGEHPDQLVLQLAVGSAEAMSGARDAALKRYAALEGDYPDNRALVLAHAQALLQVNDLASAHLAQKILRPQLSNDDEDPDLQTVFARACELAGDHVRAGEAHADAAYLNGRAEDALNQLKDLTKRSDLDYYQRARIEARIAQITPVVLELRRRKIKPEDQGSLALQPD
jgi:predicted Zn-dependent protease